MYQGERFNSISHLIGAVAGLAGLVILVVIAARQGDPWKIIKFQHLWNDSLISLCGINALSQFAWQGEDNFPYA